MQRVVESRKGEHGYSPHPSSDTWRLLTFVRVTRLRNNYDKNAFNGVSICQRRERRTHRPLFMTWRPEYDASNSMNDAGLHAVTQELLLEFPVVAIPVTMKHYVKCYASLSTPA